MRISSIADLHMRRKSAEVSRYSMPTYQHAPSKIHFLRTRSEAVRSWELGLNIFEALEGK
jgi:hypothetical protein